MVVDCSDAVQKIRSVLYCLPRPGLCHRRFQRNLQVSYSFGRMRVISGYRQDVQRREIQSTEQHLDRHT